ncbi:oxygenase MpaB family protein [Nocardiopsis sediminis]|uniref:Oxygenase MpaB family protein n=1 Tax=Nocardiopsis sediminis TaxID=1778267 RepID=A0ABV8FF36_9ACTN
MPRHPAPVPQAPHRADRRYWLRRIAALDPEADHQEIYRISSGHEFPWDYVRSLELALFKTYCVPSISGLLDATGEFALRAQKRYDDTALLMAEIAAHGYDSPRGREALRSVNRMHGRFAISNDDMRYVLSTFVYEPVDWIDRYGWRRLTRHERLAAFHYYSEVGRRMGIRDIPPSFEAFAAFKDAYEREHFRFAESNARVGGATVDLFASWFPEPVRPLAGVAVRALLDDRSREAFGFAPAPAWVVRAVQRALVVRGRLETQLPPRRVSRLAADPKNRTYPGYPQGYAVADLGAGPPAGVDPARLREKAGADAD